LYENLQLVVNIVLLVAVGALFVLLYSGNSSERSEGIPASAAAGDGQIFYVEIDQ